MVLVQPQTNDASKVNLILRPYIQPINGLNIKYFIYRGLNLSDFFSSGKVIPSGSTTSDLINNLNTGFAAYYNKINPGGTLPAWIVNMFASKGPMETFSNLRKKMAGLNN